MTDKVQKIRKEVERIHNLLPIMDGDNISINYADRICTTLEMYIDTMQEEPVSEDLGDYINELSKQFPEVSFAKLSRIAVRVAKWQKEHLWKSADGDDLPEIDREVIALEGLDKKSYYRVVFAHRVDPDRVVRTTIDNKPLELHPSKYGKAGWDLPNLKYWLDLELPNKNE